MTGGGKAAGGRPRRVRHLARLVLLAAAAVLLLRLTGCMEQLFYYPSRGPTPVPPEHPGGESVWFDSADGTRLHGWFIPARRAAGTADAATVLHVHGNAGNVGDHIWFTEYLPAAGFNLFIFDFRGYGQSEGRARRRGPLIEDTAAALDAVLARQDVDRSRIGLYGQSLGGSIALNVMADRPEIRAAVIESAFTSWRGMAASAVGGDPPGWFGRILAGTLISDGHRPVDAIARIDRPILILHGSVDSIIPTSHGRALAAAAPQATLVILPGGDHNTLRSTHPQVETMVVDFLNEHLAPGAGPGPGIPAAGAGD